METPSFKLAFNRFAVLLLVLSVILHPLMLNLEEARDIAWGGVGPAPLLQQAKLTVHFMLPWLLLLPYGPAQVLEPCSYGGGGGWGCWALVFPVVLIIATAILAAIMAAAYVRRQADPRRARRILIVLLLGYWSLGIVGACHAFLWPFTQRNAAARTLQEALGRDEVVPPGATGWFGHDYGTENGVWHNRAWPISLHFTAGPDDLSFEHQVAGNLIYVSGPAQAAALLEGEWAYILGCPYDTRVVASDERGRICSSPGRDHFVGYVDTQNRVIGAFGVRNDDRHAQMRRFLEFYGISVPAALR